MSVTAENMTQLDEYVRPRVGGKAPAMSTRTRRGEPASNHGRLAKLIGTAKVEAIYDPFLDDKGLDAFRTIVRLSGATADE
jgi:hypothetical protein